MGNNRSKAATPFEDRSGTNRQIDSRILPIPGQEEALSESIFHSMLTLERGRAERSGKPFVLMLLDANEENGNSERILQQALEIVRTSKRETDLCGWYARGAIVGIIFTEVTSEDERPIAEKLRGKIGAAFVKQLGKERASRIAISVHVFPESFNNGEYGRPGEPARYPDHKKNASRKRLHMRPTA